MNPGDGVRGLFFDPVPQAHHNPIRNKPCGFCTPCHTTREEGMTEWFGTEANIRYKLAPKLVKSSIGRRILWYI